MITVTWFHLEKERMKTDIAGMETSNKKKRTTPTNTGLGGGLKVCVALTDLVRRVSGSWQFTKWLFASLSTRTDQLLVFSMQHPKAVSREGFGCTCTWRCLGCTCSWRCLGCSWTWRRGLNGWLSGCFSGTLSPEPCRSVGWPFCHQGNQGLFAWRTPGIQGYTYGYIYTSVVVYWVWREWCCLSSWPLLRGWGVGGGGGAGLRVCMAPLFPGSMLTRVGKREQCVQLALSCLSVPPPPSPFPHGNSRCNSRWHSR